MINGHDLIDYLRRKKRFFERHGKSKIRLRVYDEIIAYVLQMINASEVADAVDDECYSRGKPGKFFSWKWGDFWNVPYLEQKADI